MIDTFYHKESGVRLSIQDYDESRTNVRYQAVINDDRLAVLHLQSVGTKDTHQDVSQLSLCPGTLESEVLPLLSQSLSNTLVCVMFLIEKLETGIVYRSRSCSLLYDERQWEGRCFSCRDLLNDLRINAGREEPSDDLRYQPDTEVRDDNGSFDDGPIECETKTELDSEREDTVKPVVIRFLKEEPVRDNDCNDFDIKQDDSEEGDVIAFHDQNELGSEQKKRKNNLELTKKGIKKKQTKSISKKKRHACPDCPVSFVSELCLVKHTRKEHGLNLPLPEPEHREKEKCPFCEEIFDIYYQKSKRVNSKPYMKQKLRRHLMYFHPDERENPLFQEIVGRFEAPKFICEDCGRSFTHNRYLENHMVAIHNSHINTVPCHICGKFFKEQFNLEIHIKNIHERSKAAVLCGVCGKTFKCNADMLSHMESFHSEEKNYKCKDCEAEFKTKKSLMRHIRKLHLKLREKTETCSQCQKTFYTLPQLKKHISDVHDKIKAFHCEECQFQCARMDNLNLHRRKSHNKKNLTKTMLISMVENDEHPFYTKNDLPMINLAQAGYG